MERIKISCYIHTMEYYTTAACIVNLKIKMFFQSERKTSIYLISIRITIWESLTQAEAQLMFWLGDKGNGYL